MEGREVGREVMCGVEGGREGGGVWRGGRWCVEGIEGGGVWRGSREVVCGGEGGVEGREVCLKRIIEEKMLGKATIGT